MSSSTAYIRSSHSQCIHRRGELHSSTDSSRAIQQVSTKAKELSQQILKNDQVFQRLQDRWKNYAHLPFFQRLASRDEAMKLLEEVRELDDERDEQKEKKEELLNQVRRFKNDSEACSIQAILKKLDELDEPIARQGGDWMSCCSEDLPTTKLNQLEKEIEDGIPGCCCSIL